MLQKLRCAFLLDNFCLYFSVIIVENDKMCTNSLMSSVDWIWLYHQNDKLLKFSKWRYTWEMVHTTDVSKTVSHHKMLHYRFLIDIIQWINTAYHVLQISWLRDAGSWVKLPRLSLLLCSVIVNKRILRDHWIKHFMVSPAFGVIAKYALFE